MVTHKIPIVKYFFRCMLRGMKNIPKTNADGFALALDYFVKQKGRKFGAKSLMAEAMGVSRAVIDSWDGVGVPRKHLKKLSEITKIKPEYLRPEIFK